MSAAVPAAEEPIEVGRIVEPWGVKGWLRVQAHAADPQTLLQSRDWQLAPPERSPPARGEPMPGSLAIQHVRRHGDGLVAKAMGIEDRSAAERFAGARILVERHRFPAPDSDEFYWADLVGCAVVNRADVAFGNVVGLLDNGVQSILRIDAGDGSVERLIPFVDAYVDDVDLAARRIRVDWGADY